MHPLCGEAGDVHHHSPPSPCNGRSGQGPSACRFHAESIRGIGGLVKRTRGAKGQSLSALTAAAVESGYPRDERQHQGALHRPRGRRERQQWCTPTATCVGGGKARGSGDRYVVSGELRGNPIHRSTRQPRQRQEVAGAEGGPRHDGAGISEGQGEGPPSRMTCCRQSGVETTEGAGVRIHKVGGFVVSLRDGDAPSTRTSRAPPQGVKAVAKPVGRTEETDHVRKRGRSLVNRDRGAGR